MEVQNLVQFNSVLSEIRTELIRLRNEAHLTQDDIAKRIGIDRRKVMELESGKIDVENLLKYCEVFDIEVTLTFKTKR